MLAAMRRALWGLSVLSLALSLGVPASDPCAAQRPRVRRTEHGGSRLHVVGRVHTGVQPKSVALSPDGREVWVANFGRPDAENVRVYDADSLALLGTIEFVGNAVELAFSPDGETAYVSNFRRHTIHEIDRATRSVRRELEVGGHPKVITVSRDGSRIYVANWGHEQVTEVDARAFTITRRLPTGVHPRGMAVARDGRVYAAAMGSHLLHVFDRDATTPRAEITPCNYPRHLALSPDDRRLYASCSCCRQVRFFDTATNRLSVIAQTGQNPRSIDLSDDGRWLAVAGFDDTTVTLIDTEALTHRVHEVPDADQIVGVAVRADDVGVRVYATSWQTGELVVLAPRP